MRRIGKFKIHRVIVDNNPEAAQAVMSKVVILRAEYMYPEDVIEYKALCEEFDEVEPATIPPDYEVVIYTNYGEEHEVTGYNVKFERR